MSYVRSDVFLALLREGTQFCRKMYKVCVFITTNKCMSCVRLLKLGNNLLYVDDVFFMTLLRQSPMKSYQKKSVRSERFELTSVCYKMWSALKKSLSEYQEKSPSLSLKNTWNWKGLTWKYSNHLPKSPTRDASS